jgi:hypothetical protein
MVGVGAVEGSGNRGGGAAADDGDLGVGSGGTVNVGEDCLTETAPEPYVRRQVVLVYIFVKEST